MPETPPFADRRDSPATDENGVYTKAQGDRLYSCLEDVRALIAKIDRENQQTKHGARQQADNKRFIADAKANEWHSEEAYTNRWRRDRAALVEQWQAAGGFVIMAIILGGPVLIAMGFVSRIGWYFLSVGWRLLN